MPSSPSGWSRTSATITCSPPATSSASPGIREELDDPPLLLVPHFDDDVHDVAGLLAVHRYLFAEAGERERLISEVVA